MLGFRRERPAKAKPMRHKLRSDLEALESRQLLSGFKHFQPQHLLVPAMASVRGPVPQPNHPIGSSARELSLLDNDGKFLTGQDRDGDSWQITLHGPGTLIVTDITPNDGALADQLDTITILGSDPQRTFVTGQVTASNRILTDGTINFNRLFAENGVNHIVLNGFNLTQTIAPPEGVPNNANTGISLPGGVQFLSFNNIIANIDLSVLNDSVDVVIGQANSPLRVRPRIEIGSIFNTVFDSTEPFNVPGSPPLVPSVNIVVNGQIQSLDIASSTRTPIESPGVASTFPLVGTTGRTAVRAQGIEGLRVNGSARNLTVSRSDVPFDNSFTGLDRIGHAIFGGVADGLALDVQKGNIGRLSFARGLGDPTGALPGGQNLGRPEFLWGNAAFGLLGGTIVADNIGRIDVAPANTVFQSVQDPKLAQQERTGSTTFFTRPGRALTNSIIMTDGSIGGATIVGDLQGSEITTGANFASFLAGLEPVRAPSQISPVRVRGNLVDSVISASFRPGNGIFGDLDENLGTTDDVAGPGAIRGTLQQGGLFRIPLPTALGNQGAGFFARLKAGGFLPPPSRPTRIDSVSLG